MKNLTLLLLMTVAWLAPARAQRTCDEALTLGDSALKKQEYRKAIDFYFAAEAFDPTPPNTRRAAPISATEKPNLDSLLAFSFISLPEAGGVS